jgi:hypothetical protein
LRKWTLFGFAGSFETQCRWWKFLRELDFKCLELKFIILIQRFV